jgi:hypothetical protein
MYARAPVLESHANRLAGANSQTAFSPPAAGLACFSKTDKKNAASVLTMVTHLITNRFHEHDSIHLRLLRLLPRP